MIYNKLILAQKGRRSTPFKIQLKQFSERWKGEEKIQSLYKCTMYINKKTKNPDIKIKNLFCFTLF